MKEVPLRGTIMLLYASFAKFHFYLMCRSQIKFLIAIENIEWLPCLFISDVIRSHERNMFLL